MGTVLLLIKIRSWNCGRKTKWGNDASGGGYADFMSSIRVKRKGKITNSGQSTTLVVAMQIANPS
ncbi:hypothetical protein HPP92_020148 [Vanilla planifolia]|uniref:Uncharacterized protein n=1 Tax=Vanilla planifolia TaxID=51239 RepID=A0A835UK01_VANPL|nr:hypothetical protein HPP92_020148 [Vanilla planifolia]